MGSMKLYIWQIGTHIMVIDGLVQKTCCAFFTIADVSKIHAIRNLKNSYGE